MKTNRTEKEMFRIPAYYQIKMTFGEAVGEIARFGRGDILEGMKAVERVWEEHSASYGSENPRFETDSDFYETYMYEVNAYNVCLSRA